jgi:hypothetical protein
MLVWPCMTCVSSGEFVTHPRKECPLFKEVWKPLPLPLASTMPMASINHRMEEFRLKNILN